MPLRLRASISRRRAKTYRYYQLVRAMRKNGKPTHDIVAHLGRLEEAEAKAIQKALDDLYGRRTAKLDDTAGKALVALEDVVGRATPRYLDVMVVHRIWQQWGFREFFNAHLRKGRSLVAPADVVEVLVVNRCLAPCSKLRVTEWAPRTVLPEVLDFRPGQLNNTRIHRVLKGLEEIESEVSRFIIQHPRHREPIDSVIYLDITDTWFEGRGGDLAAPGKCKDGANRRRRIQIALGVDARGLPLRWDVLAGNASEGGELPKWIEALAEHPEFEGLPLVFDRGFSSADNLRVLIETGRRFVTCAKKPRVADWDFGVDFELIACTPVGEMPSRKQLEEAGLWPVEGDEDVYYVDHGVRLPHRMDPFYAPGLRTVLFFRRSLFVKQTQAVEKVRQKLHDAVAEWNKDLANAKKSRSEEKTRKKVEELLKRYGFQFDYRVRLEPIEVVK